MVTPGASEISSPFRIRVTLGGLVLSVFRQACDNFAQHDPRAFPRFMETRKHSIFLN
ncbi:hypothetical protein KL86PLE_10214 [uncultured Pleomorphomonas sp.]|uniref:Uncharacterized protein n=1 Tax=uncultured Pleomorphomonas sp. TaxID=442121 RepID=A0A212KZ91_9HYPH|nr:hypothetical protein KL86PLE_10214 [uncultured Pleomorphomonas sp.]